MPDTCKLLLKVCFAKRPRNRPSFASIFNHLANLEVEIGNINEDGWRMRKEVWKRDVNDEAGKLGQNSQNGNAQELSQEQMDELVKKRMNELRHAEELRQMYSVKMQRVDMMINTLNGLLQKIDIHERQMIEQNQMLSARAETVAPPASNYSPPAINKHSGSVPEVKSVKLKKSTMTSMRGKKTATK